MRFLEKSQWWPKDRLSDYRLRRLRDFLKGAGQRVPYYKRIFSELEFNPEGLDSLDDLQRLPFLTKKNIQDHLEELKAEGSRNLTRFNTGGSTGSPLIFFLSKERVSHDVAAKWRATRWGF